MKHAKKAVVAWAAAVVAAASLLPGSPQPLDAQVIRCYDVICVKDQYGVLRCSEKLTTCPP